MDLRIDPLQERLAAAVEAALTRTGGVYRELAAIGVPELGAPERLGGLGLGLGADVMVHAELGRALEPPGPLGETSLVLDLLPGPEEVPDGLLGEIYKGAAQAVTVGVHTPAALRADADGSLWGDSGYLPAGRIGLAVVRTGDDWYLLAPDDTGCEVEETSVLGLPGRRLRLRGAHARPFRPHDPGRALDAARVRQAALLLGLAERAVENARAHVNRRIQYGRPLIELQTVAHALARLVGEADGWRLVLHEVAWRHDRGLDCRARAARILAAAAEHALACARRGLQLHGVRGMLAHSAAATAYRIVSAESVRLGTPDALWLASEQSLPAS